LQLQVIKNRKVFAKCRTELPEVQVSDATGDDSSAVAGKKNPSP